MTLYDIYFTGSFYNLLQPFNNCIRGPKSGIYVYSFSLEDNIDFQPKGSCNFSRIKNPQLVVDLVDVPPNYSDNSALQYKYICLSKKVLVKLTNQSLILPFIIVG